MCQALGVHPSKKYTVDGGPASADVMALLRECCPAGTTLRFADALFFNYLIAGTDAHAKNYSLLQLPGPQSLLAPLYDVASYLPYVVNDHERVRLAMNIGGVNEVGKLSRTSIFNLARQCEVDVQVLRGRLLGIVESARESFDAVAMEFEEAPGIDELAARFKPRLEKLCDQVYARIGANW